MTAARDPRAVAYVAGRLGVTPAFVRARPPLLEEQLFGLGMLIADVLAGAERRLRLPVGTVDRACRRFTRRGRHA